MRLIKENFEKLHQFLHDEEISTLRALSEEEEQKSQRMKEKMDKLTDEIMTLREAISSTEEVMSADDRAFLKVEIQIYIILKETAYSCDYIFRYYMHINSV